VSVRGFFGFVRLLPNVTKIPATIDFDQCGAIAVAKGSLKPGCKTVDHKV